MQGRRCIHGTLPPAQLLAQQAVTTPAAALVGAQLQTRRSVSLAHTAQPTRSLWQEQQGPWHTRIFDQS